MSDTPTTGAPPPQGARRRERPPKSADAKQRGLAGRKLQRQLEQLKATKDARKMEEAAVLMARLNGDAPPAQPPAEPQQSQQSDKPEAPKAAELSAVPATADATRPGWPSQAALADAAPTVREVVDLAAVVLAGTRFDLLAPIKVLVGAQVVERTKAELLAEKLTPLAAKYGAAVQQTPEVVAVVGLLTVFGQPLVELAMQRVLAGKAAAQVPG